MKVNSEQTTLTQAAAHPDLNTIIRDWQEGDPPSETLVYESLYRLLRSKAQQYLRLESNAKSLSPTLLVNEAYLAMARSRNTIVNDSSHFIKLAGRMMRNFLIDRARTRKAAVHGGGMQRVDWNDCLIRTEADADRVLTVAAALEDLKRQSPTLARLVEMRFFNGLTEEEVAALTGVATRTVRRQWRVARARLQDFLQG